MSTLRVSVAFSTTSELTAGNSASTSISPLSLKGALTGGNFYGINVQSVTATNFFGDGSNLTNVVYRLSGSTNTAQGLILSAAPVLGIVSLSAKNIICPPWYVGQTKKPLLAEGGTNLIS